MGSEAIRRYFGGGEPWRAGWRRRRRTLPVFSSAAAMRLVAVAGRLAAAAPRPSPFFGGVLRFLLRGLPSLPTVCQPPSSGPASSASLSGVPRECRESSQPVVGSRRGLPGGGGQGRAGTRELAAASCWALIVSKLSEPGGIGTRGRAVGGRRGVDGPPGVRAKGVRAACVASCWARCTDTEPDGGRRRREEGVSHWVPSSSR